MPEELKPVNLPFTPPDLVGNYSSAYQQSEARLNNVDPMQEFNSLMGKYANKPDSFSAINSSEIPVNGRYEKFYPGRDNEEIYAESQGMFDKVKNGVIKFTGIAATTAINGTAGLVYGISKSIQDGRFASLYDNPLTQSLDEWTNSLEDRYAHYKTQRERDGDWWEPSNLFTGNFLWDGVVKNLGYAAGAYLSGFGWGAVIKATGLTAKLSGMGVDWASKGLAAIEEAVLLPQTQRIPSTLQKLESLYFQAKGAVGKSLIKADQGIVALMGSSGEAGMEAFENMKEFRNNAINEFERTHGYKPSEEDLKSINDYAEKVGNWSWGMNVGLLTATNYVQLPKIFSSSFKAEKTELNNIQRNVLGNWESSLPKKSFNKLAYKAANVGSLLFNTSEAFEEGAQYAIQTGVQDYFSKKHEGKSADFFSSLTKGAKEALYTSEGTLNIFLGGFSGALQSSGIISTKGIGKTGKIGERGFTGYGGNQEQLRNEAIIAWNKSQFKDTLKNGIEYLDRAQY